MKKKTVLRALIALLSGPAMAAQNVSIAIDAQPLEDALREFVRQSGVQVLYRADDLPTGFRSPSVSGTLSASRGLESLLGDSGLKAEQLNERTLTLRRVRSDRLVLAQATSSSSAAVEASSEPSVPRSPAQKRSGEDTGLPEVLVRGSRSLNADIERSRDDVRPYVVIGREQIERSAASDVDELLRQRLTMNYSQGPANSLPTDTLIGNASNISLRGLANAETLILIDGRRSSSFRSSGSEFQGDISAIPLSMIERIEVLPATASGIYGGGATGGVVNIVLRRNYSGLESNLSYGNSFEPGGAQRSISVFGGHAANGGRTSLTFGGSYSDLDPLSVGDRGYISGRRYQRQEDQISFFPTSYYNAANPPISSTTNISSSRVAGVAPMLVLKSGQSVGSSITSVPANYAGPLSDNGAALVSNAGRYNVGVPLSVQNGGASADLLGGVKTGNLVVTLQQQLSDRISAFFELAGSRTDQAFHSSPLLARFTLPSTAAGNPFRQNIIVNAPLSIGDARTTSRADDGRAVVGFKASLPRGWNGGLDYSFETSVRQNTNPANQLSSSATTAVRSGSINVFKDPSTYTAALESYILPDNYISPTHSRLNDVSARLAGPVVTLDAGPILLSLLAEERRQYYGKYSATVFLSSGGVLTQDLTPGQQEVTSFYSEFRVPLVSQSAPRFGLESAELQFAARYDSYHLRATYDTAVPRASNEAATQDFRSVDPSIGLRVQPIQDVVIRGSFGTGFLPPYLNQLQESLPVTSDVSSSSWADPKRGGETVTTITRRTGGNPDLQPEQSKSWSAGVIVTPRFLSGLRISADWVRIRKTDNITLLSLSQNTINLEDQLPGFLVRAPKSSTDPFSVGPIIGADQRFRNATSALSESFDLALDYVWQTQSFGKWGIGVSGTRLQHNTRQTTPLVSPVEQAGTSVSPLWAANASLSWNYAGWGVYLTGRYLDSYWLLTDHSTDPTLGTDHIPSAAYVDIAAEYAFGDGRSGFSSLLSNSVMRIGVKNALNTPPRYYAIGAGMYDPWSDPRMATYFISVRKVLGEGR